MRRGGPAFIYSSFENARRLPWDAFCDWGLGRDRVRAWCLPAFVFAASPKFNPMTNAGSPLLFVLLAVFTGCSREGQRTADTGAGGTPNSGERTGAWTYQSTEHGFSLDFPSSGWKQITKKRFIADFWCPTAIGSPMLASITAVRKQTPEEFQTSIPQFKANFAKGADYLLKPAFQEGLTPAGIQYVFAAACEKGASGTQFIYVATAVVYLPTKGIAVTTIFEGQGHMRSKAFQSIEYADFESAAKSICLSPR